MYEDMQDGLSSFSYLLTATVCCAQPREIDSARTLPSRPSQSSDER